MRVGRGRGIWDGVLRCLRLGDGRVVDWEEGEEGHEGRKMDDFEGVGKKR